MRIVHVIPTLSRRAGGGDRACAELAEAQAQLGMDVRVVHFKSDDDWVLSNVTQYAVPRGVRAPFHYGASMGGFLKAALEGSDVVHVHALWNYPGWLAARLAKAKRVPYVLQPHGSLHPWKLRHKGLRKWLYGVVVERWIIRNAAAIQAESIADRRDIERFAGEADIFMAPCGIDTAPWVQRDRSEDVVELQRRELPSRFLLFLARLDVNKGVDICLRAFARLQQEQELFLVVAGPAFGSVEIEMKRLAEELGVAERVRWLGQVAEDEKRILMAQARAYVLPSLSENFGISILEAVISATPVVTTTATPWENLRAFGVHRVVDPNVDAVTEAIRDVLQLDADARDSGCKAAQAWAVQKFDHRGVATGVISEYRRVLEAFRRTR